MEEPLGRLNEPSAHRTLWSLALLPPRRIRGNTAFAILQCSVLRKRVAEESARLYGDEGLSEASTEPQTLRTPRGGADFVYGPPSSTRGSRVSRWRPTSRDASLGTGRGPRSAVRLHGRQEGARHTPLTLAATCEKLKSPSETARQEGYAELLEMVSRCVEEAKLDAYDNEDDFVGPSIVERRVAMQRTIMRNDILKQIKKICLTDALKSEAWTEDNENDDYAGSVQADKNAERGTFVDAANLAVICTDTGNGRIVSLKQKLPEVSVKVTLPASWFTASCSLLAPSRLLRCPLLFSCCFRTSRLEEDIYICIYLYTHPRSDGVYCHARCTYSRACNKLDVNDKIQAAAALACLGLKCREGYWCCRNAVSNNGTSRCHAGTRTA